MYFHGSWTQWSLGRVAQVTSKDVGVKVHLGVIWGIYFWLQCFEEWSGMSLRYSGGSMNMFIANQDGRVFSYWYFGQKSMAPCFIFIAQSFCDNPKNLWFLSQFQHANVTNQAPVQLELRPARDGPNKSVFLQACTQFKPLRYVQLGRIDLTLNSLSIANERNQSPSMHQMQSL